MLLSIDQGTTSTRAVIYDPATFQVRGLAQREISQSYPNPGWVEHNAPLTRDTHDNRDRA